jgi:hypothetical protein
MTTIGGGFVWPNITVFSDGERVVLLAKPTQNVPQEPLRYIADHVAVVRAGEFENLIDDFVEKVIGKLLAEEISATNLNEIWNNVGAERADAAVAMRRKFEAMLGFDPDEADPATIEGLVADSASLGESAMSEIAAHKTMSGKVLNAAELRAVASTGYDATLGSVINLATRASLPPVGQIPAWRRGAEAAQNLRLQEHLGAAPLSNQRLAEMLGVNRRILSEDVVGPEISFVLNEAPNSARIVLHPKRETGRRFEMSRLLGDQLTTAGQCLFPATKAYTYRQKMQRSFAAELLCPFEALADMLHGDYSAEAIEEASEYFSVSELTVRTLLVNHECLSRGEIEGEFELRAAA